MPSRVRCIVIPAVLMIGFLATPYSTTDSNTLQVNGQLSYARQGSSNAVSAEKAVNIVRQAPEVKWFSSEQQREGFIQVSGPIDDSNWIIQVYGIAGENGEVQMTQTFNWYMVDVTSAAIVCSMYEYNNEEYVGYNDDYPCRQ